MPIPGVGGWEFLIILIAALMIFGPSKLPEVMGQMGKAVRDFRRMTTNFTSDFEKNLNDAAGTDVRKTLSDELSGIKNEVEGVGKKVQGDVNKGIGATTSGSKTNTSSSRTSPIKATSAKSATTSTTSGTKVSSTRAGSGNKSTTASAVTNGTSRSTTTGAKAAATVAKAVPEPPPVASKADPLSDVSFFDIDADPGVERPARRARPATTDDRSPAAARATAEEAVQARANGSDPVPVDGDDPFARARQRRASAGYQRAVAAAR